MNKGCGKFKWSVSFVGGWCGITLIHPFTKRVHYCRKCRLKFVKSGRQEK